MILTHLVLFSFFNGAGTVAVFVPTPGPSRGINDAPINGMRDYLYLTGDINGPSLTWDEIPLSVPPSDAVWNIIGSGNAAIVVGIRGINDAAINALRDYLTGTGDVNGPSFTWDEVEPTNTPSNTIWNRP